MSFLKAEWRKLILVNYEIDPMILQSFVPFGTELDLWNDICYVSLVGFKFVNTRLLGIRIPFHVNFEEVNLRFYVRYQDGNTWKRGVVFIKEIVPKPALSLVANTIYKEHYQTLPMQYEWDISAQEIRVKYAWKYQKTWNSVQVSAAAEPLPILAESEAAFITEHYWGYTRVNSTTTFEYEVTHPTWQQYAVHETNIEVDFGKVYGNKFGLLTQQTPKSVMLAEGSEITVESKRKIK